MERDGPAGRLIVEYAATESFQNARRIVGSAALPETGHTTKVVLTGLPAGQDVFYRATFLDLADMKTASEPVVGRFRTAPVDGGTSPSCGRATPSAKAGASTRPGRAARSTR